MYVTEMVEVCILKDFCRLTPFFLPFEVGCS